MSEISPVWVVAIHDFCCSCLPSPTSYGWLPGAEGLGGPSTSSGAERKLDERCPRRQLRRGERRSSRGWGRWVWRPRSQ